MAHTILVDRLLFSAIISDKIQNTKRNMTDILIQGEINDDLFKRLGNFFSSLSSPSNLDFYFDTGGGYVAAGRKIVGLFEEEKKKHTITATNINEVSSIAVPVFLSIDVRATCNGTAFMVHETTNSVYTMLTMSGYTIPNKPNPNPATVATIANVPDGDSAIWWKLNATELRRILAAHDRDDTISIAYVAKRTGINQSIISECYLNAKHFSPSDALSYNFVQTILPVVPNTPTMLCI